MSGKQQPKTIVCDKRTSQLSISEEKMNLNTTITSLRLQGKRAKSHFANKGGKGKFTGNSKGKNRGMGQSKAQKKKANPSRGKWSF